MAYKEKIKELSKKIRKELIDFDEPRKHPSAPTQLSSEFLTNKEQGDWAELTLLNGINNNSKDYIAVKYGRGDNISAGDEGWSEFFENYQCELDDIGKRPDILIFNKKDYPYKFYEISNKDREFLDKLVPKAICGIEVRSSAFLINEYESFMCCKIEKHYQNIIAERKIILEDYKELLKDKDQALYEVIESINDDNVQAISFRCKSWKSSQELVDLSSHLKLLKENLQELQKRTYLSITPKVEDIKVVYKWIQKYNVPHYYVQVFFDEAYGISFEQIMSYLTKPELEDKEYFLESDIKNQNKTTIKISARKQVKILEKIVLPEHYSEMKQLDKGRLLFYVKFKDSLSTIYKEGIKDLIGIEL